jgi:hypothetical protein
VLATSQLVHVGAQGLAALHNPRFKSARVCGVCLELRVHHLLQLSNHTVGLLYVLLYCSNIHSIMEYGILGQREL